MFNWIIKRKNLKRLEGTIVYSKLLGVHIRVHKAYDYNDWIWEKVYLDNDGKWVSAISSRRFGTSDYDIRLVLKADSKNKEVYNGR